MAARLHGLLKVRMDKRMRSDDNDMLEKICFNCNQFFPYPMYEATENGICLNDEVFEPHIDDIFNDNINPSLRNILEVKKYPGEHESCKNFEPIDNEEVDYDPDNPLAQELLHLLDTGKINKQTIDTAFIMISKSRLIILIGKPFLLTGMQPS